jgi:hypothetical protein
MEFSFRVRMVDTMTSQNTGLSSWENLYMGFILIRRLHLMTLIPQVSQFFTHCYYILVLPTAVTLFRISPCRAPNISLQPYFHPAQESSMYNEYNDVSYVIYAIETSLHRPGLLPSRHLLYTFTKSVQRKPHGRLTCLSRGTTILQWILIHAIRSWCRPISRTPSPN